MTKANADAALDQMRKTVDADMKQLYAAVATAELLDDLQFQLAGLISGDYGQGGYGITPAMNVRSIV